MKQLFKLLVEQFGEETAGKRQIALLFALLDSDQPVENIKSLMGETDNSSVVRCGNVSIFSTPPSGSSLRQRRFFREDFSLYCRWLFFFDFFCQNRTLVAAK